MAELNKLSNSQNSPEASKKWRVEGDLFDEGSGVERTPDSTAVGRALAGVAMQGIEQSVGVNKPVSADEYLALQDAQRRQFGRTDERLAYQPGVPRSAVRPARQAHGTGRPVPSAEDVEADDVFFEGLNGPGQ